MNQIRYMLRYSVVCLNFGQNCSIWVVQISFVSDFDFWVGGWVDQIRNTPTFSVACLNFWKKMLIIGGPNFTICISFVLDLDIGMEGKVNQIRLYAEV